MREYRNLTASAPEKSERGCEESELMRTTLRRGRPGYYPHSSTLSQQAHWDEATRQTILSRLTNDHELRFFTEEEATRIERIFAHILPQDDREERFRIPIVPVVDNRLFHVRNDSDRCQGMPCDPQAYRLGIVAIDRMAQTLHGREFLDLRWRLQDELLLRLHDGKPAGAEEIWSKLPVRRFWRLLVQDAIEAYYAHPYAWDEIGFGGPAFPRAYLRLEHGEAEPWEVEEHRYEWEAPADSVSDQYETPAACRQLNVLPRQGGMR